MEVTKEVDALVQKGWDTADACEILQLAYCDLLIMSLTKLNLADETVREYMKAILEIQKIKDEYLLRGVNNE
ncbi:MAG: hypothetical protein QXV73_03980 [Candidatus Micrarchaeia archaeon]